MAAEGTSARGRRRDADATVRSHFRRRLVLALRDAAALAVLAREADLPRLAEVALNRADVARTLTARTSTQENAWLLLAA